WAPSSAKASAMARPMPRAPPATTATCPLSCKSTEKLLTREGSSEVEVPDDDLAALAAGGGPHAVRGDGKAQQRPGVPVVGRVRAPRPRVPESRRAVVADRRQEPALRRERDRLEVEAAGLHPAREPDRPARPR